MVEMRQLSKNEQTEINFDERISSTPRSAQRCSEKNVDIGSSISLEA